MQKRLSELMKTFHEQSLFEGVFWHFRVSARQVRDPTPPKVTGLA
ncbi:MAG: hypothetical protein JWN25_3506 [Verrucomicrobiales bacterium]|nr:hypothetical protein [Verrucomicrobiales bacterium]